MTELPDYWRLSIAAGVEEPPVGNAFVIDEGRALTCAHLFEEYPLRDAEHVWIRRLGHPAVPWRMPRSQVVPVADAATDICVLPIPRSFGAVAARLGARLRPESPTVVRA